jgi:hypothetical protein
MTISEIVSAYVRDHRESTRSEMRRFEETSCLSDAIRMAFCLMPNQKRHLHQRRRSRAVLEEGARRLQRSTKELLLVSDFAALHDIVERKVGNVRDIGPLTVYDVAHRIGAFLRKSPELVYLHSGTKIGAAALGLSGKTIHPNELPPSFSRLTAAECEDCLCIYKDALRDGNSTIPSKRRLHSSRPCHVKSMYRSAAVSSRCVAESDRPDIPTNKGCCGS